MWLYILLALFSVIAFFMFLKVRLCIVYKDDLSVKLRVMFFNIPLYPKKAKKIKPKDFSLKTLRKKQAKLDKKAKTPPAEKTKNESPQKTKKEKVSEIFDLIKLVLNNVMSPFGRYLKIEIVTMHIKVGGDDPAKTAITYGLASQGIAYIVELLSNITNVDVKKKGSINVYADFFSNNFDADINITLGLRVWHAFSLAVKFFMAYLKKSAKTKIS